ncbi:MAG: family 10 glycosylhydrolase [Lentisphaerae bacterium]|jgi:hypothetical protein|nr:family 10 glycosylhydrolase [Lentisphaerota bacterium]MBT4823277.1 family 10 glycosylhydrolase [Lentisphaerota bacterium]MBT5607686.1 family 10 glycosylhydrolase [Lentisphaerota bacterium]MBT7056044.1 family 10 glycosylhydrolase [Lentisphaerota bacterium]MBT7847376.1 family 10 glycosylhydrolase [Lentisphaerota bacterium]
MPIRSLLKKSPPLLVATLCLTQHAATPVAEGKLPEALAKARRELAHKPRRIVFNNDGDDHIAAGPATKEAFLKARLSPLRGSHVDTVVYCTSRPFGMYTHATQVGDVLVDPMARGDRRNIVQELLQAGTDPLALAVEFCRESDMEILWTMRMNDCHDTSHSPDTPHVYFSSFKKEHPEWLLGTKANRPRIGNWTAVDFAQPEVSEFVCKVIEDVVARYDVDGVELDFFRHLVYFRSVAAGGEATSDERRVLTGMVRNVRTILDRRATQLGRPLLLTARTPDNPAYCRTIGIDLERWLEAGLLDVWVAGGDFRLNARQSSVELGRKHDVPVWCDLDPSIRSDNSGPFNRNAIESLRARALGAWAAGASSVYLFNWFNPHHPLWRELGDPALLRGRPRTYFANVMGRSGYLTEDSALADGGRFRQIVAPHPADPGRVPAGAPLDVLFELGEQPQEDIVASCHVLAGGAETLSATLGGADLGNGRRSGAWRMFDVPAALLGSPTRTLSLRTTSSTRPDEGTWDVDTDPASLLSPGAGTDAPWNLGRGSPRTHRELIDGDLLIADRGTERGDYLYVSLGWMADPRKPAVVEVTAKVMSGKSGIIVANGEYEEKIWLSSDHAAAESAKLHLPVAATDGYHVYRIELVGDTISLAVDGKRATEGKIAQRAHAGRNTLAFGASTSGTLGEARWRRVRCRTGSGGAVVYDVVLTVGMKQ